MPAFLRIWRGLSRRGRCRHCQRALLWVIDDRKKSFPFRIDATPLRSEQDAVTLAWFDVYDATTAFHSTVCTRPKKQPARRATAPQPRLL